jgi:hypothetical protein
VSDRANRSEVNQLVTDLYLGAFLEPGESVLWSLVGAGKALSQRILAGSDLRLFQVDPGRSTSVRSWPVADVVSVDDNGKWNAFRGSSGDLTRVFPDRKLVDYQPTVLVIRLRGITALATRTR